MTAICDYTSLKDVRLGSNDLEPEGALDIPEALQQNSTLDFVPVPQVPIEELVKQTYTHKTLVAAGGKLSGGPSTAR